ncbi:MAG TPA: thioredoxin domain-containing protein [Silvibacterium sp.]|nr:thioredoxin domain-containing protein [Silvibacterium sp.]
MHRIRLTLVCLLALAAAGCKAQTTPQNNLDPITTRKIDVLVRAKLNVPSEYQIAIGPRTPSDVAGFDTVPITFSLAGHPDHSQTISFLLSKDGKTLARLSKWDISKDPADMIPSADRPVRGNPNAKVVIVNYDDLECPYCAKMHAELFPETLDHYNGLVKIVYRDLPLEELHPWAVHAAVNANCLAAQSATAYWGYVDYLHTHGQDVTGPDRDLAKSNATLDKLARLQGETSKLDAARLDACIAKQDESAVRAEMKQADGMGIQQTPTVYVNGEMLAGAMPVSALWSIIDRALVSEGITPPPNEFNQPAKPAQQRSQPGSQSGAQPDSKSAAPVSAPATKTPAGKS